ncbi:putative mitochondrial hypothetical protein [Leptomonas pyrrhocoris]|uniref:Uncharacterized protein n=1 Tax=Leptomonas pyrrhocoris TaxID=157538 RepID=A0A0N0DV16_LEPPY|nr:putative mitochondrial hypothetical protein [Leptomonas pyrrhocoris]XP_015658112.1 putative mitochondrial hypothetical protein [Leptomonas pyrrhocoris]KPA79672.1 putative mitochondrial hypothetical protein [Leptomonas pyrrhocoris]KPA79673.1 putative mitochondrial hypothetical protein [Leptomonas pyrrhocoris]|eukprot:XP_015658111.1 putative mitochondrial hypothetical protein [Leptomonas pyrrhocoris]
MEPLARNLARASPLPCRRPPPFQWGATSRATGRTHNRVALPFHVHLVAAALVCTARSLHTSQPILQQQSSRPPPNDGGDGARTKPSGYSAAHPSPSSPSEPPSIEPVLTELRTIVTRQYPLGDVYRALKPESRKILIAHKLPLEELLLHLPHNFALYRTPTMKKGWQRQLASGIIVCPPQLLPQSSKAVRLPPTAKPLPALVSLLGEEKARACISTAATTSASVPIGAGTGFVNSSTTPMERLQEVLTYIPNEWTQFTSLNVSLDVKLRCMGFPQTRPFHFFLKHPNYFDVRAQHTRQHTFEVRRSLALQKQLKETAPPQK